MGISCCKSFESLIGSINHKGVSAEISDSTEAPYTLFFRATDKDKELAFKEEIKKGEVKTGHILTAEIRIKYCPWCGSKLERTH
jgi:hypothetical protein